MEIIGKWRHFPLSQTRGRFAGRREGVSGDGAPGEGASGEGGPTSGATPCTRVAPREALWAFPKTFLGPRQRVCQQEGQEPTFPGRRGVVLLLGGAGCFSKAECQLLLLSQLCTITDLTFPFLENMAGPRGVYVESRAVPNPAKGSVGPLAGVPSLRASACCWGECSPLFPLTHLFPSARPSLGGRSKAKRRRKTTVTGG